MKFTMKNRMKPCLCISLAIMAIALVMTLVGYGMNLAMIQYMPLRGALSFCGGAIDPAMIQNMLDYLNS